LAAKLRDSAQRAANGIGRDYLSSATLCNRVKTRTETLSSITNQLLYQLSYAGSNHPICQTSRKSRGETLSF
jgi:hypothetical protein